ncbi:cyclin-dependent kinase C-2-like [Zea mays]|uniref:Uncharacterized protein n=1 Tax=Zea mays TaxID=4577 RepID=A0A804MQC9_MAIZE|nr:cyclin-dependent kinase C-2-like [Zea mays]
MPWYNNFKPHRPLKRRVKDFFKHFDRHALDLLEKMLTLDPSQRISAKDALDEEYFWTSRAMSATVNTMRIRAPRWRRLCRRP